MKKLLFLFVLMLSFFLILSAVQAETFKVFGKAKLKSGATVMFVQKNGTRLLPAIAFDDQEFYIVAKIELDNGIVYLADGYGFRHKCPDHGLEILNQKILLLFSDDIEQISGGMIKLELF